MSPIGDRKIFELRILSGDYKPMVSSVDKYVAEQVKEKRIAKGVSQSDLAFELDVPTSFIGMIESGKYEKKYNIAHINAIAKILECSPREFLPADPL